MDYTTIYPSVYDRASDHKAIDDYAESYKQFLNHCKTERDAVRYLTEVAMEFGFDSLSDWEQEMLHPGARLFMRKQNKAMAMMVLGHHSPADGLRIICAHIDSPRLDLRPNPVTEDGELVRLRTHYYGGIKKYQWVTQPLALHGRAIRGGGECVDLCIGEEPEDPVFYISDLPKHLSAEQVKKPLGDAISGEDLSAVAASGNGDRFMALLQERYGLSAREIATAELCFVPAMQARDVGLDGSLIAAYGQDDKICAYAALRALLAVPEPEYATLVLFADKEEVGSVGSTGMNSRMLENFAAPVFTRLGMIDRLHAALEQSEFISADVIAGYDSIDPSAFAEDNTARLGRGPVLIKYTGQNGKKSSNAAGAEFLAALRDTFDAEGICWQVGEMGRIDLGGGGTIAPFAATYGMSCVDCGPAVLSMHAPCELSSKADAYETFRAYRAFYAGRHQPGTYYGCE